jgi:hypothetical protein
MIQTTRDIVQFDGDISNRAVSARPAFPFITVAKHCEDDLLNETTIHIRTFFHSTGQQGRSLLLAIVVHLVIPRSQPRQLPLEIEVVEHSGLFNTG